MDYKSKYLKYKEKYLQLKQEAGATILENLNNKPLTTAAALTLGVGVGVPVAAVVGSTKLITKGIQAVGREIKKTIKSDEVTNDEIKEINRIIIKYHLLTDDVYNEDNKIDVELFLNKIKRQIKILKLTTNNYEITKKKDLNYLLGKHYMCKGNGIFVYENNDCFEKRK